MSKEWNRVLYYDDPHPTGGSIRTTLTERQAIAWVKKIAPAGLFDTDQQALDEFIVVHWASYLDEEIT